MMHQDMLDSTYFLVSVGMHRYLVLWLLPKVVLETASRSDLNEFCVGEGDMLKMTSLVKIEMYHALLLMEIFTTETSFGTCKIGQDRVGCCF